MKHAAQPRKPRLVELSSTTGAVNALPMPVHAGRLKQLLAQTQLVASVQDPYRPVDSAQWKEHACAACLPSDLAEQQIRQVRRAGSRRGAFKLPQSCRQFRHIDGGGLKDTWLEGSKQTPSGSFFAASSQQPIISVLVQARRGSGSNAQCRQFKHVT